ncbi:ABC transporter ATP-binding protein [Poriferisphaera corsica]|uniref:ABC transporter ATP-binding protein n=1 Tax=Poriferisphaera corsica TaxID=2528020 RepID=A0A517YU30_9BACT|nr:ABC transporter ATP-binding protein [Poriferisphaera corsica]QDU33731.1 ABC transporter ATP-binding protein [Poriferisphaera corsica]
MSKPVAVINDVYKIYQKNKDAPAVHALDGVSVTIPEGQYLAIMGPSGSGKSTLMNMLGCLDRPTKGDYLVDGTNVAQMNDEDLSQIRGQKLGFVFQAFNLIPQLTVLENVQVPLFYQGLPKHLREEAAKDALSKVSLSDRLTHRPSQLSGGQMQRVAIARALVNKPAILLADEPTGNLDSKTGNDILNMFDDLHRGGLTIIMVTHDESVADRCQRIIRLKDGKLDRDEMMQPTTA